MAEKSTRSVALLAIKPEYASQIFARKKKVEFRKIRFSKQVDTVVVYVSSPVQRVLGWFDVSFIEEGSPKVLWERHRGYGGIERKEFFEYYAARSVGVAIGIKKVKKLKKPVPISFLEPNLRPPQSFSYLPSRSFSELANL